MHAKFKPLTDTIWDVIVIGGGPAGMMAAGRAGLNGKSVLLIEKNNALGKKLDITGGGRCNITNAEYDVRKLLKNYGEAEPFLYSPFSRFGVKDTFSFFEKRFLPIVIEARNRAFPKTQLATDVTKVMKKYVAEGKAEVRTNCTVSNVTQIKGKFSVATSEGEYRCKNLVVATGGFSHPETGSTGEGFKWLSNLGHTVKKSNPNIVPMTVKEQWIKDLSGTTLSFMKITFMLNGKKAFSKTGKILFTHFGLSGPLILNSSKQVGEMLKGGDIQAEIDMYPDSNFPDLEKKIIAVLENNKNKNVSNILDNIVPHGMSKTIFFLLNLEHQDFKVHSFSAEMRRKLIHILKGAPITITGLLGFEKAVISDGGIPLDEIDTKTMQSKIVPGLFLVGDTLHVDRPSGGFSLQLCWTTGFVAGSSIQ